MSKPATLSEALKVKEYKDSQGEWIPACGGSEVPFKTRSGRTFLYCYQPSSGRHAYLDVGTDIIMSDDEALAELM